MFFDDSVIRRITKLEYDAIKVVLKLAQEAEGPHIFCVCCEAIMYRDKGTLVRTRDGFAFGFCDNCRDINGMNDCLADHYFLDMIGFWNP